MEDDNPRREFGTRRPAVIPAAEPVKRSRHVALLMMGTFAVGGGAYALMPRSNCDPGQPAMAAPSPLQCSSRGGYSSGFHGGYWARSNFFGGDSSSSRPSSGTASDSGPGGVTRGGFGSFARAFAAHFSGGG